MDQPVFSSLSQNTLRMSAVNAIRESILNGILRPGAQLVQAEIAAQMNISRAPVREALRQLEDEGLVESIPYRGTFVSRVTRQDILELYSLRGALEGLAVRLAIMRSDERDVHDLGLILEQMAEAANCQDYSALNAADIDFHTRVCVLSRHRHLIRNWETNANLIRRVLALRNKLSPFQVVVDMHRPIVEAFRGKDVDAAQRAVEEHCTSSGEALAAIWTEEQDYPRSGEESDTHAHPGH